MFFEQNPILDALWTIGVFVAAWCLATLVMAFLGYCIHNGLRWMEPRLLDLNVNGGRRRRTAPTTAMPLGPRLEVDADGRRLRCHRRRDWKLMEMERRRRCHRRRDWKLMEMEKRLVHPQVLAFHPSAQIESQTPPNLSGKAASASSSVQGAGKRRAAITPIHPDNRELQPLKQHE